MQKEYNLKSSNDNNILGSIAISASGPPHATPSSVTPTHQAHAAKSCKKKISRK